MRIGQRRFTKGLEDLIPSSTCVYNFESEGEKYNAASVEEKIETIKADAKNAPRTLLKFDDENKKKIFNDKYVSICMEENREALKSKLSEFVELSNDFNLKKYSLWRLLRSNAMLKKLAMDENEFIKKYILGINMETEQEQVMTFYVTLKIRQIF